MTQPDNGQLTIDTPKLKRLSLMLHGNGLVAIVRSTVDDSYFKNISLCYKSPEQPVRAIEDTIYEHPWLLSEFKHVDILAASTARIIVPAGISPEIEQAAIDNAELENDGATSAPNSIFRDVIPSAASTVIWSMDCDIARFLARTFHNVSPRHMLTPLIDYFQHKSSMGNSGKLYVHFRSEDCSTADIIAFDKRQRLMLVTTINYRTPDDAAYYILTAMRSAGLDIDHDEILISGNIDSREAVTAALSRFSNHVMPVIFPSELFKAGKEALKAPFPLILTSIL